MKRILAAGVVTFSVLGFVVASLPSSNLNKSDGGQVIEYGMPLRWLTVSQRLSTVEERTRSSEWWVTEARSSSLTSLACDLAVAGLIGATLSVLAARTWRAIVRRSAKPAGSG